MQEKNINGVWFEPTLGLLRLQDPKSQVLERTINAVSVGADVESIHDMLIAEGLSEYNAWLTYKAAQLVVKSREKEQCPEHDQP